MRHLFEMGERFCNTAERLLAEGSGKDDFTFQNLHWGLELVLKAYLHTHGWDDQRCIVEVRHDLGKALAACEDHGLPGVCAKHRLFLAQFSPYSRVHRVEEFVRGGAAGWTAEAAIALSSSLRQAVRQALA